MSTAVRSCALVLAAITAGLAVNFAADSDVNELFRKARAKVLGNIDRTPRYTCVENIVRAQYLSPVIARGASCATLIEARRQHQSPGEMIWRDRLRIDVAIVDGAEMFSWAGAGKFETNSLEKMVGTGSTGSGDFASFLSSVFGDGPEAIRYRGLENDHAVFEYTVPLGRSHYRYSTNGPEKSIGYSGSFFLDPADGELQRLIVQTDVMPPGEMACRATDVMDYHTVKIGSGEFMLPELTTMDVLFQKGSESRNETRYTDCREYVGESTIRFDDVDTPAKAEVQKASLRPLPPKLKLQVSLASPINGETAAAGDAISAVVLHNVKEKGAGVLIHEKDRIHGRILRIEQAFLPTARWTLVLSFDSIERSGTEQPIALQQVGGMEFHFPVHGALNLDQSFHSEWETR